MVRASVFSLRKPEPLGERKAERSQSLAKANSTSPVVNINPLDDVAGGFVDLGEGTRGGRTRGEVGDTLCAGAQRVTWSRSGELVGAIGVISERSRERPAERCLTGLLNIKRG